ncbi:hypothetical protein EDC04DRAFT_2898755 [Pisolithus marmoratus]|nr:hypothetical protein EDC04DRAFT_2898755 [Pisolithus marmoratus]
MAQSIDGLRQPLQNTSTNATNQDIPVNMEVNEPQALGQATTNKEVSAIADSNQLEGDTATGHEESMNETNPLGQGTMATGNQETMGAGDATKGGENSKEGQAETATAKAKGKRREMEKKLVSAVRDPPTQQVQELMDRIKSHVAKATLGYALMVVMDDNDLGQGPKLERQQVNLQNVDPKFMANFIKGVDEHGLFNKYIENALDVSVHRKDIDTSSLVGAQSPDHPYKNHVRWLASAPQSNAVLYNGNHRVTYMQTSSSCVEAFNQHKLAMLSMGTVTSHVMREPMVESVKRARTIIHDRGVWLVRFVDLDFIQGHQESVYIETHLAGNQILPSNQDSENDSFHTVMNILLKMPNMETRHKHVDSILETVSSYSGSNLGKVLKDKLMFDALFELFRYEHFHSRDNTKHGLSMWCISHWYPTFAGMSHPIITSLELTSDHTSSTQCMIHIIKVSALILDFLAAPVDFVDVTKDLEPGEDISDAFLAQYSSLKAEFNKPIPAEAREILDNKYFSRWTDQYVSQFHKAQDSMLFEYFASNIPQEQKAYQRQLSNYWTTMIREAEAECKEATASSSTDDIGYRIKMAMPAKLKALQHHLLHQLHPNHLLDQFPIPNKGFLYMLSEQLRYVEAAIKEVAIWIEPFTLVAVDQKPPLWRDHIRGIENIWHEKLQATKLYKAIFEERQRSLMAIQNYIKTAEKQLKIKEDLLGKEFCSSAMKQYIQESRSQLLKQGITASKAREGHMMTLPRLVDVPAFGDVEAEQQDFLIFLSDILCHTSFPWLDSGNVKKVETLLKKLMPVYISYKIQDAVLATESGWELRARFQSIIDGLRERGHVEESWSWYDGIGDQPRCEDMDRLDLTSAAMPLEKNDTPGAHNKMRQIVSAVLTEGLGRAPNDDQMMIPEVREKLDDLIHTLKVYSEMTVHRLRDPTVAFDADTLDVDELDELYPISLPPSMSDAAFNALVTAQKGSGLRKLRSLVPYQDEVEALWQSEKSRKTNAAKRKADLDQAFRKSKIVEGKATYVRRMAAMKKKQAKSAEFVEEEDDDDDEDSTNADDSDDSPQASPSTTNKKSAEWSLESWSEAGDGKERRSLKRNLEQAGHSHGPQSSQRQRLLVTNADTSDAIPYDWHNYRDVICGIRASGSFKSLPGLLFVVRWLVDHVRSHQATTSNSETLLAKLISVINTPNTLPDAKLVLDEIIALEPSVPKSMKYIKVARRLMLEGKAYKVIDLKVAASWIN